MCDANIIPVLFRTVLNCGFLTKFRTTYGSVTIFASAKKRPQKGLKSQQKQGFGKRQNIKGK